MVKFLDFCFFKITKHQILRNDWEQEKLEKFVKQYRNTVYIEDHIPYTQITIKNTGTIEKRSIKFGVYIGRKRQFKIDLINYPDTLTFVRQGVEDGSIGFVPKTLNNAIVTENMPLFTISGINKYFLETMTKTPNYYKKVIFNNFSSGSAQKSIHEKLWLNSSLLFPNEQEQICLGKFFSSINDSITLHHRELNL